MDWQSNQNMRAAMGEQPPKEKKEGNGYGIASLILGCISLLLFCTCVNWITAILALIFGILQLTGYKQKGLAIGGIITAGLSMLASLVLYFCIFAAASFESYSEFLGAICIYFQ